MANHYKIKTKVFYMLIEYPDPYNTQMFFMKINEFLEDLEDADVKFEQFNKDTLFIATVKYKENMKLKLARKLCQ